MSDRITKEEYYLGIADAVLRRSTCLRRRYGAVIVRDDEVISTGYNGAPRERVNCVDCGYCEREEKDVPHNSDYSTCRAVHAEANSIISASRRDMIGATLYLAGEDAKTNEKLNDIECCEMCKRMVINSGISKVVTRCGEVSTRDWIFNDETIKRWKG